MNNSKIIMQIYGVNSPAIKRGHFLNLSLTWDRIVKKRIVVRLTAFLSYRSLGKNDHFIDYYK